MGCSWDQIAIIELALVEKYDGRVTPGAIHREVIDVATAMDGARIRAYVPVLIQREADDRVRRLVSA